MKDKMVSIVTAVVVIGYFALVGYAYYTESEQLQNILVAVFIIGFVLLVVVSIVLQVSQQSKYMKEQQTSGKDKAKVRELMAEVLGQQASDFSYVLGFFERTEQISSRKRRTWFYSYILAFNRSDMIILPFVVKDGELILRNRMNVNWSEMRLKYHFYKDDINLDFIQGGEQINMYIRKVVKSSGEENSSRPLGMFQAEEQELLRSYLPGYPNVTKA